MLYKEIIDLIVTTLMVIGIFYLTIVIIKSWRKEGKNGNRK